MKSSKCGFAALMASSLNGSRSSGAVQISTLLRGSAPDSASSINKLSRSASVGACVLMMIESGLS
ncbi:hypothetical protein D3C80_2128970 [compost metagenome]